MASEVLETRCVHPPWRGAPTIRTPNWSGPMGTTRLGSATIPLSVLRISVCVSLLSPAWLPSSAFTDVGPMFLVSYWYLSYGAHFLCWDLTYGETAKALPNTGEGWPSVLKGIQNANLTRGQKLTHSPAREEKHAEQETPVHYTHCCQHQPSKVGLAELHSAPARLADPKPIRSTGRPRQ